MKPLDGCYAKLERAKKQTDALDRLAKIFLKSKPYALIDQIDPDTGEYVITLKVHRSHPLNWAVIAGEITHNLRSMLDHFIWQLVLLCGGTPTTHTQFPIVDDPDDFSKPRVKLMTEGLDNDALTFIKSLQPYTRWERDRAKLTTDECSLLARTHPLFTLRTFSNVEKHQILLDPSPIFLGGIVHAPIEEIRDLFLRVSDRWGVYEDGAEIFREKLAPGIDPDMDMHFDPTLLISFSRRATYRNPAETAPFPGIFGIIAGWIETRVMGRARSAFGY